MEDRNPAEQIESDEDVVSVDDAEEDKDQNVDTLQQAAVDKFNDYVTDQLQQEPKVS